MNRETVRKLILPTQVADEAVVVLHAAGADGFFLPIAVLLDTGSDTSLLTQNTARALGLRVTGLPDDYKPIATVGREEIRYLPVFIHFVVGGNEASPVCVTVHGGVADPRLSRNIVGCDFVRQFEFTWTRNAIELTPGLEGW